MSRDFWDFRDPISLFFFKYNYWYFRQNQMIFKTLDEYFEYLLIFIYLRIC